MSNIFATPAAINETTPPIFTRTSDAYKQDGSVVNANVPRFETDGVMVEEGTVNLLTNPLLISNASGWAIYDYLNRTSHELINDDNGGFKVKFTSAVDSGDTHGALRQVVNGIVAGDSYTITIVMEADATLLSLFWGHRASDMGIYARFRDATNTILSYIHVSEKIELSSNKWVLIGTGVAPANAIKIECYFGADVPNITTGENFTISKPQLEAKPYATSFHPTTRAAESLTIPASAINASEGSIEFDVMPLAGRVQSGEIPYLLDTRGTGQTSLNNMFGIQVGQNQLLLLYGTGTTYKQVSTSAFLETSIKKRCALRYENTSISLWFDGQQRASGNDLSLILSDILSLGSTYDKIRQANALFSNLRISNKARSDAELANTGALAVDEWTTYYAELNDNLNAYKRSFATAKIARVSV